MANRILKDYENVSLNIDDIQGCLDFDDIFGRKGPIHIEIGSGKGTFLVNQARYHPEISFLGIEWARKYYRVAVDRLGRWSIPNVRVTRTDAATFVAEKLADASVDCFHIYFPDPWPKKRHHKRRFFSEPNVLQLLRCLKPAGIIQFATDHEGYFEQVEEVLATQSVSEKTKKIEFTRAADAQEKEVVGTNYERKYIKAGKPIYTAAVRKIPC